MKNLSLFVSSLALCASTSYAAINCSTLPTCESLGYNDIIANCPNQNKVLKCPFDVKFGKCIHDAAIWQIAYFTDKAPKGWLFCDGSEIHKNDYPELYEVLKNRFCTEYHGGSCGTSIGRLPDYRGLFLRAIIADINATGKSVSKEFYNYAPVKAEEDIINDLNRDAITPKKQGLPNITGHWVPSIRNPGTQFADGAFGTYQHKKDNVTSWSSASAHATKGFWFDASKANPIYGSAVSVLPVNIGVYVYIYAGR